MIIHFDTESTGISVSKDRIIQLSLIETDLNLRIINKKKYLMNNCGVPIHPKAFEAHGISEEMIKYCQPFSFYAKEIHFLISECNYIHGYNIKGFDIPLLHQEFARCGINWVPKPAIDSCNIFKIKEKRTLSAASEFYCGKKLENAHDAENDVVASIEVLDGQMFRYGINIEDLVKESMFEGEENRADFAGKIIKENGVLVWNFGKNIGKPIKNDIGYCDWVLNSDFTENTKNIVRDAIK